MSATDRLRRLFSFVLCFMCLMAVTIGQTVDCEARPRPRVLFLGDSLSAGGSWPELLPEAETINQGVSGETTGQILQRLERVIAARPEVIFLLAGINDFSLPRWEEQVLANHQEIWRELRQGLPAARLYVISLTPMEEWRYPGVSRRIRLLNLRLSREADRAGLTFIDLYSPLADESGGLRREYTYDGLHLTAEGYRVWAETIRPCLVESDQ